MCQRDRDFCRLWVAMGTLLLLLAACAGPQTRYPVPAGEGEKTVPLVATSFDFEPGVIAARQGDRLLLRVDNRSGTEHNLTVLSPAGEVLVDRVLPGETVVEIPLTLTAAGTYPFHCGKFMHPAMGMKGEIVAAPN